MLKAARTIVIAAASLTFMSLFVAAGAGGTNQTPSDRAEVFETRENGRLRAPIPSSVAERFRLFRAYPHLDRAYRKLAEGDLVGARDDFDRGLAIAPIHPPAQYQQVLISMSLTDYDRAIADSDALLKLAPDFAPVHVYRATAALALGRTRLANESIEALKEKQDRLPPDAQALLQKVVATLTAMRLADLSAPQPNTVQDQPDESRLKDNVASLDSPSHPRPPGRPAWKPEPRALTPPPARPLLKPPVPKPLLTRYEVEKKSPLFTEATPHTGTDHKIVALTQAFEAFEAGAFDLALTSFAKAKTLAPDDPKIPVYMGYTYLALEAPEKALDKFLLGKSTAAQGYQLDAEIGYLALKLGKKDLAKSAFRSAILTQDIPDETQERLRRERAALISRPHLDGYAIYRGSALSSTELILAGTTLGQSQAGIEGSLPLDFGVLPFSPRVFSRLLWGFEGDTLSVDGDSLQAGAGISFRPLPRENLVLTGERLIGVGQFARDDWLIRAGYSRGDGFQAPLDGRRWWTRWEVFGDFTVIDPSDPDLFSTVQGLIGRSRSLGKHVVMTALLGSQFVVQRAGEVTTLWEGGPGLLTRFSFNEGRAYAALSHIDVRLDYRVKFAGSSANGNGIALTLSSRF
ncbi:MAG: hypothetical protein AAGF15_08610 [Pseudomonadota bacterium]